MRLATLLEGVNNKFFKVNLKKYILLKNGCFKAIFFSPSTYIRDYENVNSSRILEAVLTMLQQHYEMSGGAFRKRGLRTSVLLLAIFSSWFFNQTLSIYILMPTVFERKHSY